MWRGVFIRIEFVDREYINPKKKILKNLDTQEIMTVEIQDDVENVSVEGTKLNAENLNKNFSEAKEIFISPTEPTADEVLWVKRGKNLFDKESSIINGQYISSAGELVNNQNAWYQAEYIKVLQNKEYIVKSEQPILRVIFYNKNKEFISRVTTESTELLFATPSNCEYLRISGQICTPSQLDSLQLEQGSVATDYEEHIDTTLNIKENGSFSEILNIDKFITTNAGFHNSLYRGKNITDLFYNGTLSKQIAAGTFDDIFIGDYIIGKLSGRKYLVADINYRLNCGDTECTKPHILMIPEKIMGTAKMNNTNITTGAYVGSAMYTNNLAQFKTIIRNDFETGHILTHRNYLANATTNGYESGGTWADSDIELMNELMVYGSNIFHNVINGTNVPQNHTVDKAQLSLFRLDKSKIVALNDAGARTWYWLRDVVSSADFASVYYSGLAGNYYSSGSNGVRPAFLVY